jgi:hypothetical protein
MYWAFNPDNGNLLWSTLAGRGCCSFHGSVVALDVNTGRVIWQVYDVPAGHSGGGVWQPVAIDVARGSVFVGTGNNYKVPGEVKSCLAAANAAAATNCFDPADQKAASVGLYYQFRKGHVAGFPVGEVRESPEFQREQFVGKKRAHTGRSNFARRLFMSASSASGRVPRIATSAATRAITSKHNPILNYAATDYHAEASCPAAVPTSTGSMVAETDAN